MQDSDVGPSKDFIEPKAIGLADPDITPLLYEVEGVCGLNLPNLLMVVGGGFEPPKGCPSRFTVCPRWPLGYPTSLVKMGKLVSDLVFAKPFFEQFVLMVLAQENRAVHASFQRIPDSLKL